MKESISTFSWDRLGVLRQTFGLKKHRGNTNRYKKPNLNFEQNIQNSRNSLNFSNPQELSAPEKKR
jgi:hypothetical protein